ncbi:MAG TPA: hypothetical protein VJH91_03370 [Candidatus Paceibacterota bacterium]
MKKGRLIVFEGIDGAGKQTQSAALARRLRAQGKRVTVFTSPRYDLPTGKLVRNALRGEYGDFVGLSPYISALPYLVDFVAWRDDVLKALEKGTVICDRYVQSTICYHSAKLAGKKQKEFLKTISDIAFKELQLPEPNVVVLLDVPVPYAQKLIAQKKKDQHEKNTGYQRKVAIVYKMLARGKKWRTISCVKNGTLLSRGDISDLVWKQVSR